MTKDPTQDQPQGHVIAKRTLLVTTVGVLITAIGVLTALLPFDFGMQSGRGESDAGSSSPVVTASTASSDPTATASGSASEVPAAQQASRMGDCLGADSSVVACDVEHREEVFAVAGDCSRATLVRYLGGIPQTDVLREDLTSTQRDDGSCVVALPESLTASTTLKDILLTSENVQFRRCYDDMADRDVNCGEVHTAEYVFEEVGRGAHTVDCAQNATDYMATEIAAMFRSLEVQSLLSEERALCKVSVKGSNTLVGSLRNLGPKSVPLVAR